MTKIRRIVVAGIPAGVACLVLAILATLPPNNRPGVTKANFDRIEKGMTRADVDAIFGQSSAPGGAGWVEVTWTGRGVFTFESWRGDNGASADLLLFKDVVEKKSWNESTESITATILRRLHWPWW